MKEKRLTNRWIRLNDWMCRLNDDAERSKQIQLNYNNKQVKMLLTWSWLGAIKGATITAKHLHLMALLIHVRSSVNMDVADLH